MHEIEAEYRRKHPKSAALAEEALSVFPSGLTHDTRRFDPFPLYVERAQGSRKWDVDGLEYIDYVMGHGSLILGHSHPSVVEAVSTQMARGTHYGASHPLEIEWAKLIIGLIPTAERVRFHSSGTEATMMAIRLARAFTGRTKVIKFEDHFHGWHDLVSGATVPDDDVPAALGVARQLMETLYSLPPGDIDAVRRVLRDDPDDVAAVIIEPTGAHYGERPIPPSFLHELRQATEEAGVLLIFDEVVTGFRIAPGGAQQRYGVRPDLTTLAKIVAGGLPGGAVTGRADIMSVLDFRSEERVTEGRVYHPGTFNANPLSAAAALAVLPQVRAGAPEVAEMLAGPLVVAMNRAFASSGVPGAAWRHASIVHYTIGTPCPRPDGVEWTHAERPPLPNPVLLTAMMQALLNRGVYFMGAGNAAFVSAVHTEADIDATAAVFEAALGDLKTAGLA